MRLKKRNKMKKKQFYPILFLFASICVSALLMVSTPGCLLNSRGLFEGEFDEVTAPPPDGCAGEYYRFDLHSGINLRGTSSPIVFEITTGHIPDGLTLDEVTGIISGIPTTAADYTFEIVAQNSSDVDPAGNFTIRIRNFSIIEDYLPPACSGVSYGTIIHICGGTENFNYQIIDGPDFLTLGVTGETPHRYNTLTGTPPTAGTYDFTFRVTDSTGNVDSKLFSLYVSGDKRITSPQNLPLAIERVRYSDYTLQACGGSPPYTWSCNPDSLPAGLNLSAAGVLSGEPADLSAGVYNISIRLRDSDDSEHQGIIKSFYLTVIGARLTVRPITPPIPECSFINSAIAGASGGLGEKRWEVLNLPPEMADGSVRFTPDGDNLNISWIPQLPGIYPPFIVRVQDATSLPVETPVTLIVNEIPDFGIEIVRVFHMESRDDPDNEIYLDENNDGIVDSSDHRFKIRFRVTDGACAAAVGSSDDIFSAGTTNIKIIGFCDESIPSVIINYDPVAMVYLALFEAEPFSGLLERTGGSITGEYRTVRLRIEVNCMALNAHGSPIRYIASTGEVRVLPARPLQP